MSGFTRVRRIRNEFELQDQVDSLGRDSALVEQDFALMTIAAGLVARYGDALCFKGGFVLRHVHGHERFSKDIDATGSIHRRTNSTRPTSRKSSATPACATS